MRTDLESVFDRIRPFYEAQEIDCVVVHDSPGKYYLDTHEVRARDGYRTGFGGVEIKKNYVSAHLMPVYVHPDLLGGISAALKKRMQGKSCFNFRKEDPELFEELATLVEAGFRRFKADGRL